MGEKRAPSVTATAAALTGVVLGFILALGGSVVAVLTGLGILRYAGPATEISATIARSGIDVGATVTQIGVGIVLCLIGVAVLVISLSWFPAAAEHHPTERRLQMGPASPSRGRESTNSTSYPLPLSRGLGLVQALLVLGALVAGLVAFVMAMTAVFPGLGTGKPPGKPPEDVKTYNVGPPGQHIEGELHYAQSPPVGGKHNPVWQNCGFYAEPIREENAVHSLEHGAVWITYSPDILPKEEVELLRELAQSQTYLLVSPYHPGLDSPVVASAWGKQLPLQSAKDPDLERFIRAYVQGPRAPEPGAPCTGGVGQPQ
jgi:hypothetical protein